MLMFYTSINSNMRILAFSKTFWNALFDEKTQSEISWHANLNKNNYIL
jgi:hypothetical protein